MRINVPVVWMLAFAAAACASPVALRPDAKSIPVVRESEQPLHCRVVAEIAGRGRGKDQASANESAMNEFRNSAADNKATHALVEKETGGPVGTTDAMQAFVGGKALQCGENAGDDESAASPATSGSGASPPAP